MFTKILTAGAALTAAAASASAAVVTSVPTGGLLPGDVLVDVSSANADIATVFGAVIGVIVFIFGIRKVYGMITRS